MDKPDKKISILWGMVIYASVFVAVVLLGLRWLWTFLDDYEQSRPIYRIEDYIDSLTPEYICDAAGELAEKVDPLVQDEDTCRRIMLDAVQGEITYAKKVSESTETRQVFSLCCDGQTIGAFAIEQEGKSRYGFASWNVTEEEFDLSYLLTEPVQVIVPQDYQVFINGNRLSGENICRRDIPYEELAEFSDSYVMPCMMEYKAGPFLREPVISIADAKGILVEGAIDAKQVLSNCSEQERIALEQLVTGFVREYVNFAANNGEATEDVYRQLYQHIVPGSRLSRRLSQSIAAIEWVAPHEASVVSLEINLYTRIEEELYLCDVTYTVEDRGMVRENHLKLICRETARGLLVEEIATC